MQNMAKCAHRLATTRNLLFGISFCSARRRAIIPFLCAAALTLTAVPGLARVGVVVGIAPPAPVVEAVPAPPSPGYMSGSLVTEAGTASSISGCPVHTSPPPTFTRYGSPEPGSGMAPVWVWVTGGTGDGEAGGACLRRKQSRLLPESPSAGNRPRAAGKSAQGPQKLWEVSHRGMRYRISD